MKSQPPKRKTVRRLQKWRAEPRSAEKPIPARKSEMQATLLETEANHLFVDIESEESRKKLAQMLLRLFEHWKLNQNEQLNLLGMSEQSRGSLDKYRKGSSPLPKTRDLLDRAGYLLTIHKALRLLYPKNPEVRYSWVNRRNTNFENFTPLDIMQKQGIIGMARVARYLDFIRGH